MYMNVGLCVKGSCFSLSPLLLLSPNTFCSDYHVSASSRPTVCPPGRRKKELPQYIANGLHDILHNPPDLAAQRLLLFEQAQPITMPMEEFAAYWPYVSNIWKYVNKRTRKDDGTLVEYYECRLFAPTSLPKKIAIPDAPMRSSRDGGKCRCTMKVETPKNGEKRLKGRPFTRSRSRGLYQDQRRIFVSGRSTSTLSLLRSYLTSKQPDGLKVTSLFKL